MKYLDLAGLGHFLKKIKELLNTKANDNNVVKLSGDQTVNGRKTFSDLIVNNNVEIKQDRILNKAFLNIHYEDGNPATQHAARFIAFYINNTRTAYVGYPSSKGSDFTIVNSTGGLNVDIRGDLNLIKQSNVKNIRNPVDSQDAATKRYVDDYVNNLKQEIKGIAFRSIDFAQFKQEIQNW